MPLISLILCTHNPRADYFESTLRAISAQSLDRKEWEFIVVDNASTSANEAFEKLYICRPDLEVNEPRLGLTNARLRGIRESKGATLVFVDDDNVLDRFYLQNVREIFEQHPEVGAAGGRILPLFEKEEPSWLPPWRNYLACREFGDQVILSTELKWGPWCPIGAGLAVRRSAVMQYVEIVESSPVHLRFGRRGASLVSGEDADLIYTLLRHGWKTGYFPVLKVSHLIAKQRMRFFHMLRLVKNIKFSNWNVRRLHGIDLNPTCTPHDLLRVTRSQELGSIANRIRWLALWSAGAWGETTARLGLTL
ncbi:MAG TPA: glycosyltransferase [Bdellovibrionota bacterium]|nr:glycosyltransferase [Bdellovibrionota bacterium]